MGRFSQEPTTNVQQPNLDQSLIIKPLITDDAKLLLEKHIEKPQPAVVITSDEIVADYLHQKQEELEQDYDARPHIISDSDDLGKLCDIIDAFQLLQGIDVEQLRLGHKVLPEHLQIIINDGSLAIGFLNVNGQSFTKRIQNFNQLVISYPKTQFRIICDAREPQITGKVGKEEIEKFNYSPNATYTLMDRVERIHFELTYNLIIDIRNLDLDADMKTALRVLATKLGSYWLTSILLPQN
jgi:hypothetical protein